MGATFNKFIDNNGFSDDSRDIAILKTAERFVTQAVALSPVDTGRLRNSIDKIKDGNDYLVGTNVEYAAHQEFGTKWQKAQPFLRPTAYLMKNQSVTAEQFNQFLAGIT